MTTPWSLRIPAPALVQNLGLIGAADGAMLVAAGELQSEWKKVLSRPGSGKLYEAGMSFFTTAGAPRRVVAYRTAHGGPRRSTAHRASAPGDPPATDFGHLRAAVDIEREGVAAYRVGMGGNEGRIGLALEYGVNVAGSKVGRHPAKNFRIDPRPHGRVAVEEGLPNMRESALRVAKRTK